MSRGKVSEDGKHRSSISDYHQKTSTILPSSHHQDSERTPNEANTA